MRVLGLVPARGGSKGIPRKNIRTLQGRPLLAYTADAARESQVLTRTILSTDDPEIAEAGRQCGLEVPFIRPEEFARDDTPSLAVVQHALKWLEELRESYDVVCLLQPTHPLRRGSDIDGCVELLVRECADSVITVVPLGPEYNPYRVYLRTDSGELQLATGKAAPIYRRQELPAAFRREGSVYATRVPVVLEGNSLYGSRILGYPVEASRSVNLDNFEDWSRAEAMLASRGTLAGGDGQLAVPWKS
jgi:CMP-N,N'-diacetyllegionaminic acid synthase